MIKRDKNETCNYNHLKTSDNSNIQKSVFDYTVDDVLDTIGKFTGYSNQVFAHVGLPIPTTSDEKDYFLKLIEIKYTIKFNKKNRKYTITYKNKRRTTKSKTEALQKIKEKAKEEQEKPEAQKISEELNIKKMQVHSNGKNVQDGWKVFDNFKDMCNYFGLQRTHKPFSKEHIITGLSWNHVIDYDRNFESSYYYVRPKKKIDRLLEEGKAVLIENIPINLYSNQYLKPLNFTEELFLRLAYRADPTTSAEFLFQLFYHVRLICEVSYMADRTDFEDYGTLAWKIFDEIVYGALEKYRNNLFKTDTFKKYIDKISGYVTDNEDIIRSYNDTTLKQSMGEALKDFNEANPFNVFSTPFKMTRDVDRKQYNSYLKDRYSQNNSTLETLKKNCLKDLKRSAPGLTQDQTKKIAETLALDRLNENIRYPVYNISFIYPEGKWSKKEEKTIDMVTKMDKESMFKERRDMVLFLEIFRARCHYILDSAMKGIYLVKMTKKTKNNLKNHIEKLHEMIDIYCVYTTCPTYEGAVKYIHNWKELEEVEKEEESLGIDLDKFYSSSYLEQQFMANQYPTLDRISYHYNSKDHPDSQLYFIEKGIQRASKYEIKLKEQIADEINEM